MDFSKENIKITNYIVGFHHFYKDHNYGNFKGDFINEIQVLFNTNFDKIKIAETEVLKNKDDLFFEIQLTPNKLTYRHNLDFEEMCNKSEMILNIWLKYSKASKIKLTGLVSQFIIVNPVEINTESLYIKKFFAPNKVSDKIRASDFHLNFLFNKNGCDYNISISLAERLNQKNRLQGSLDFNFISEDIEKGIDTHKRKDVYDLSQQYLYNDFLEYLNLK